MKYSGLTILVCLLSSTVCAEPTGAPVNLDNVPVVSGEEDDFETDAFGGNMIRPQVIQSMPSDEPVRVDTRQSLTKNIKNNAPAEIQGDDPGEVVSSAGSWVGQLIETAKDRVGTSSDGALSNMIEESKGRNTRANASVFDISGVMLRMSYQQAEAALMRNGYRKTTQKLDIPNFIRWRNEEKCRNQGVIGYERLENCVTKLAREEHYQYISQAQFNKYDSKETIRIFLTSTFTNNKIYKITYKTEAANNAGNSPKAVYLRNLKVYDFWKKINQKYGVPDNKEDVLWGLGGTKPYLKAATGYLLLEDPMLRELDYTRMSREDQRFMNTDLYTF